MLTYPLTKIIATVGPASSDPAVIGQLIQAGVSVFRMNFSHGSHQAHAEIYHSIRATAEKMGVPIAILQDIQGPKLRIGAFKDGSVQLDQGATFSLVRGMELGTSTAVGFVDEGWFDDLQVGHRIILGDGNIILRVTVKTANELITEVVAGGIVRSKWGLNFPDSHITLRAITDKDRDDLAFGKTLGFDAVALSFVQSPDDLREAKRVLGDPPYPLLIAKIEHPTALEHINEILAECDGLMVARGDLGLTIPIEQLPTVQKRLIHLCRDLGKIVITATQMLESMTTTPQPTRAEVTDVANAVYDGTDAVMLSGETAVGINPVNVVQVMARILKEAEPHAHFALPIRVDRTIESAVVVAIRDLVEELSVKAILVPVTSGSTPIRLSRQRLGVPIVAGTNEPETIQKMMFRSAVFAHLITNPDAMFANLKIAIDRSKQVGICVDGDTLLFAGGFPVKKHGVTNFVRAIVVGEEI